MRKFQVHFAFSIFAILFSAVFLRAQPSWSALGTGLNGTGNTMTFYHGELYAAGAFSSAGSVACNNIAKWDGTSWPPLGTGTNGIVYAMTVYNDELYVAGGFTSAGGLSTKRI